MSYIISRGFPESNETCARTQAILCGVAEALELPVEAHQRSCATSPEERDKRLKTARLHRTGTISLGNKRAGRGDLNRARRSFTVSCSWHPATRKTPPR